ncbi:Trp-Asp (WD) repeats circular profile [Nakaseomyces glabratus]
MPATAIDSFNNISSKSHEYVNVVENVAVKFLQSAFENEHINAIEDDRYNHVITRIQSRFKNSLTPNEILAFEFHPAGHSLAYSRIDGSITIWPSIQATFIPGKMIHIKDACGTDKLVTSISWNPNEITQLITSCNSDELDIWEYDELNLKASKVRSISVDHKTKLNNALFDPTGEYILAITKSDSIYLFSAKDDYRLLHTIKLKSIMSSDTLYSVTWDNSDPLGRYLFSGSKDGSCSIWELRTLICIKEISGLESNILSMDICHLGKMLGLCLEDERVCFCDVTTGKIIYESSLSGSNSEPLLRFFPDKTMFILSGKNDTLEKHFYGSGKLSLLSVLSTESRKNGDSKGHSKGISKKSSKKSNTDREKSQGPRSTRPNRKSRFLASKRR